MLVKTVCSTAMYAKTIKAIVRVCWSVKREHEGSNDCIKREQHLLDRPLLLACHPLFGSWWRFKRRAKSVRLEMSHRNWFTLRVAGV